MEHKSSHLRPMNEIATVVKRVRVSVYGNATYQISHLTSLHVLMNVKTPLFTITTETKVLNA